MTRRLMARPLMVRYLTEAEWEALVVKTGLREVTTTEMPAEGVRNRVKAVMALLAVLALVFVPGPLP